MPKAAAKLKVDPVQAALDRAPHARTDEDARLLPAGEGGKEKEYTYGSGLSLRVQGGSRQWICYYRLRLPDGTSAGKKRYAIGPIAIKDVSAARIKAASVMEQARGGTDPRLAEAEEKQKALPTPTFGQHAEAYMDRYLPTLKNQNSANKWRNSLRTHCAKIWNLPVDQVLLSHVLMVLDPIWKKIPVMASEVRARMETILNDATVRSLRSGDNPAQLTDALADALGGRPPESGATRGAMASIAPDDMPALMVKLRAKQTQTARALATTALTCLRTSEVIPMRLRELDLDAEQPMWTIPYARFKVDPHKKDFQVPLSPQAVDILREQIAELEAIYGKGNVDDIWPAQTKGRRKTAKRAPTPHISSGTMLKYLKTTMGIEATVHGFRATFETWSDDQFMEGSEVTPKYHPHAVEFCLAHKPGNRVKQSYRRGTMLKARVSIMRDWADHCVPPQPAAKADNVVALKERKSTHG